MRRAQADGGGQRERAAVVRDHSVRLLDHAGVSVAREEAVEHPHDTPEGAPVECFGQPRLTVVALGLMGARRPGAKHSPDAERQDVVEVTHVGEAGALRGAAVDRERDDAPLALGALCPCPTELTE